MLFRFLKLFAEPLKVPMQYRKRLGSGRVVSVVVSDNGFELNSLEVKFERKIEHSDVVGGKLISTSHEEVKRRGAKRHTTIALSYQSAEALHAVLGGALRDARKRHFWLDLSTRVISGLFESMPRLAAPK